MPGEMGEGSTMVAESTQEWFRGLVRETQQRFGELSRLQEEPERFRARVERDGVIVHVAPGGNLVDLRLEPSAMRLGAEELAAAILRAQREGLAEANRLYAAAVDDATGRTVDVSALVTQRIDTSALRDHAEELDR
ncbi:YbaB/EbfC family nucleoid-associated protein [Paractinoplanes rhizophilus]|uniref:YbaB/EbfC family nucleoid-associated protein n=1 Tax=Paractinoplanes rhizophilus TaxID=1416877 RepID=A0ABW2HU04_9ACTN